MSTNKRLSLKTNTLEVWDSDKLLQPSRKNRFDYFASKSLLDHKCGTAILLQSDEKKMKY